MTASSVPEIQRSRLEVPHRTAAFELIGNDLFQLTLTEENKADIFEYGLTKLNRSQDEATTILHYLAQWDSNTRSLFAARSASTILNTPFRLVYPNSDLPAFEKTGLYVRQYMAVSYCWRSEDFLPHGYERHGSWPISRPFVDAIIGEKNHPRVGIWMDQLCINQVSAIDKQKCVAAMDIIYKSCIRLLVLLEDVYLDEREIALCNKYDPSKVAYDLAWRPSKIEKQVFDSFRDKVNAARWWQRAWCFHEFNVNEPWGDMRQGSKIHNATFIMNGPNGSTVKMKWWTLHYVMGTAINDGVGQEIFVPVDVGDREPGYRGSLMARHNAVIKKGCLLLEDKLSIMINMSGLALAYQGPTVNSEDELLYIVSLIALAAGETYPITMFKGQTLPELEGRPSWFQRHLFADVSIPRFKLKGLHGIYRISMQDIELDMVFLPPPFTWKDVEGKELKCTYNIFPNTIETTRIVTHGPISEHLVTASQPDSDLDRPRRRFLAACITNGYSFTARLWAQLKEDVVGVNYNQGLFQDLAPNPSLLSAAKQLIAHLLPVSQVLGLPISLTFTLEDAHLFLTWLTDPRSMYYISIYTYRIPCTVDGQGAFTTGAQVNAHFQDGPFNEVRAALPTDLLDASCIPLRIWLLRPSNTEDAEGKWRLVGKAILLGEPDLRKEAAESEGQGNAVVELRRAVVSG
ncbi:O-methyltransferase family 2 [Stagonosporopsis vannaccii]|nr:O-methyltransferase family 2 [Stagonosporopsis vannaccii]